LAATRASSNDTPSCSYLKYGVRTLLNEVQKKNKKIKGLQQIIRRKDKKIFSMCQIICKLKNNNVFTEVDFDIQSLGKHTDLITKWSNKNLGEKVPKNVVHL